MPTEGSPAWKRILRRIGQVVGGLGAVVGLLIVVALAINARDEELTPEAKAMLTPPVNRLASDNNLYVAMEGLDAPTGESMVEVGEARIRRFNETVELLSRRPELHLKEMERRNSGALHFKGGTGSCRALEASLWNEVPAKEGAIATDLDNNQELYSRYLSLQHLAGYYETARPSVVGPVVLAIGAPQLRCLFLQQVALSIRSGQAPKVRQALDYLTADIHMWTAVLTGYGSVLSKLLASGYLHADFLIVLDMIADPAFDPSILDNYAPELVKPMPIDEWKIGKRYVAEAMITRSILKTMRGQWQDEEANSVIVWLRRQTNAIALYTLKTNATDNFLADYVNKIQATGDGDPAQFTQSLAQLREWMDGRFKTAKSLYNPLGKFMVWLGTSYYLEYLSRGYDVAAFQRLVCLAYEIRRQGITVERVQAFMQQHPELSRHPIDNKPFEWDAKAGIIKVKTVSQHPVKWRSSVKVTGQ
jgi:hypothetical protein